MAGSALALLAPTAVAAAPASPGAVQMAVAKWPGQAETQEALTTAATKLTERAIQELGGLARFIKKGASVWIKPNINFHRTPEFAANTHPDVVATVVRLCLEAGAGKVRVGDNSSFGSAKSYPMSGIEPAAKAAGAEVVYLEEAKFKEYPINGRVMQTWPLCPEIVEADVLINLPVAKHHPLPKVSCCIKNLMGMAGGNRSLWHASLAEYLCDLSSFVKPHLHIVDALRILTAGPPQGGNPDDVKYVGMIAAGVDPVALDAWAAELLGNQPADVPSIAAAAKRGLGQIDYRQLILREVTVA